MRILIRAVKALFSALRRLLSIKSPEVIEDKVKERDFKRIIEKLVSEKAMNVDALEAVKEDIQRFGRAALAKKRERDRAPGDVKSIVTGEIKRIFRDAKRQQGRVEIISGNLERISVAESKAKEALDALKRGADEDTLDTIGIELIEILDDLVAADKARRDLERVRYQPPVEVDEDVEGKLEALEGAKETHSEFSKQEEDWLKELEEE